MSALQLLSGGGFGKSKMRTRVSRHHFALEELDPFS